MSAHPLDARARRTSALLARYYDAAVDDALEVGTNVDPIARRETWRDDEFDVDAVLADALRSRNGDGITRTHARVCSELRQCASRAQGLVRDNYGTFTRAAGASGALRDATREMLKQCEDLRVRARAARRLSERAHERLSARRETAERLRGARGLARALSSALRTAPALEELARAMGRERAQRIDASEEDVRGVILNYVEVREVLDALGGEGSDAKALRRAKRRCDDALKVIVDRLKERARTSALGDDAASGDDETTTSSSTTRDLIELGVSDEMCLELLAVLRVSQVELRDDFLKSRKQRLASKLESAKTLMANDVANPKAFMSELNQLFLGEFTAALDAFEKMFAEADDSRRALVKFTKEAFVDYFVLVREAYAPDADVAGLMNPKQLMSAMGTMAADLASVHRAVPEAALGDRAMETVERIVRSRVGVAFASLERDLVREVNATYEAAKSASAEAANRQPSVDASSETSFGKKLLLQRFIALSDTLLTSVHSLLHDVESLMDERPILISSWREEFAYMVRGHFASLIHALVALLIVGCPISPDPAPNPTPLRTPLAVAIVTATTMVSKTPPPPSFSLVCARMCAFLNTSAMKHIAEALGKMFPAAMVTGGDFNLDDTHLMCESASNALLTWYVEQSAHRVGFMIRKSLTAADWSKVREPREVRPLADFISNFLSSVESECEQVLDVGEIDRDGVASSNADAIEGAFAPVTSTQSSVMCAVIKRALKTYIECVRCQTFPTKFAYQQLAVDVRFLAEHVLLRFTPSGQFALDARETRAVKTLLDELRAAAAQRSFDPSPMDTAVMDRIIAGSASS